MESKLDYLHPVDLKLKRAQFKLDEIFLSLEKFIAEERIQVSAKISDDGYVIEHYANNFSEDLFLEEVGIMIGEFTHLLRSSFDNLVYALARTLSDPPINEKILTFPIYTDKEIYVKKTKGILEQLPSEAAQLITNLQPFSLNQIPNFENTRYVLSMISQLNNLDKHRIPNVVFAVSNIIDFNGSMEFYDQNATKYIDEKSEFYKFYPVLPNAKILDMTLIERLKHMDMKFNITFFLAIEIYGCNHNVAILRNLYESTSVVINKFRRYF